jgi:hypothetical protein
VSWFVYWNGIDAFARNSALFKVASMTPCHKFIIPLHENPKKLALNIREE